MIEVINPQTPYGVVETISKSIKGAKRITICNEVNARQYEVLIKHEDNTHQWYYVHMGESHLCKINVNTRQRWDYVEW